MRNRSHSCGKLGLSTLMNEKFADESTHCFFSLQEPLEMKFPNISYSALSLMKVRKLQLLEEPCTEINKCHLV